MHGYAIQCIENLEFACCWFFFILLLCCFLVVFVCFLVCYYNKNFHGPLKNLESYCVEIAKYNMKLKCT